MISVFSRVGNVPFYFFLGVELVCLILGLGWAISSEWNEYDKARNDSIKLVHKPSSDQILVIAEEEQRQFTISEMEVYSSSQQADYKMIITSREEAINTFAQYDKAILILSRQLSEEEIRTSDLNVSRLPLKQEVIDHSSAETSTSLPVFVRDNTTTADENELAGFLMNNTAQDLVHQKMKSKTVRSVARKG